MANYIVGDLQAFLSPLKQLLSKVDFNPSKDTLWAVGDLIGRGPQALETLQFLSSLEDSCKVVLGNHDLHFLSVFSGIRKNKKSDNFDALLSAPSCARLVSWLRQQPLARQIDDSHFLVHAGLYPMWSPLEMVERSNEIERVLQSDDWQVFLEQMYGNSPDNWRDAESKKARRRFIVNACTRMRYVTRKADLEFDTKSHPSDKPKHLIPWFEKKNEKLLDSQKVFFGHWATLMGQTGHPQFIGLDTGYIWGGKMTMVHVETGNRITQQANFALAPDTQP